MGNVLYPPEQVQQISAGWARCILGMPAGVADRVAAKLLGRRADEAEQAGRVEECAVYRTAAELLVDEDLVLERAVETATVSEQGTEHRHQRNMERWASRYDELNGAPEGPEDR